MSDLPAGFCGNEIRPEEHRLGAGGNSDSPRGGFVSRLPTVHEQYKAVSFTEIPVLLEPVDLDSET